RRLRTVCSWHEPNPALRDEFPRCSTTAISAALRIARAARLTAPGMPGPQAPAAQRRAVSSIGDTSMLVPRLITAFASVLVAIVSVAHAQSGCAIVYADNWAFLFATPER